MCQLTLVLFVCAAFIASVLSESCQNPSITSTSFTTEDATIVTNIAFISEFTVKCASGRASNLYAEVSGNIIPASSVGEDQYQVSWTEDVKTVRSSNKIVRVFDEEGYAALRKAMRSGEPLSSVESLADVTVNYSGVYNGPLLKSELFATIISLVVAYFAISFRLKVTA